MTGSHGHPIHRAVSHIRCVYTVLYTMAPKRKGKGKARETASKRVRVPVLIADHRFTIHHECAPGLSLQDALPGIERAGREAAVRKLGLLESQELECEPMIAFQPSTVSDFVDLKGTAVMRMGIPPPGPRTGSDGQGSSAGAGCARCGILEEQTRNLQKLVAKQDARIAAQDARINKLFAKIEEQDGEIRSLKKDNKSLRATHKKQAAWLAELREDAKAAHDIRLRILLTKARWKAVELAGVQPGEQQTWRSYFANLPKARLASIGASAALLELYKSGAVALNETAHEADKELLRRAAAKEKDPRWAQAYRQVFGTDP